MSTFLIPQIVPMFGPGHHGFHGGPFFGLPLLLILGGIAFWLFRSGRLARFGVGPGQHGPHGAHGPRGPFGPHGPGQHRRFGGPGWGPFSPTAEAEKTLANRLANGDITAEEYRERLHALRTANPTPGGPESTWEPPFRQEPPAAESPAAEPPTTESPGADPKA